MPIYEYVCGKCGKLSDVLQKLNDPPPEQCNACGAKGPMTKIVSRSSFVLRGGGWYSDLYSSTKKDGASKGADSGSSDGKAAEPKDTGSSSASSPAKTESAPPASSTGSSTGTKE